MTMIDRLGGMTLKDLTTLRLNADRLSKIAGRQQADATALLSAIELEMTERDQVKLDLAARKAQRAALAKAEKRDKAARVPKPKKLVTASQKADALVADVDEAIKRL